MIHSLSIILPTFNERQNLEILIPEILEATWAISSRKIRLIVVDDNSDDGTALVLNKYAAKDSRFAYIIRTARPSLPLSLWDGINLASTDYVAWLDADGSMPVSDLVRFVSIVQAEELDVVIGSRFISGGGFKGLNQIGRTTVKDFYSNLKRSQDSVLAVVLSRILNILLQIILRAGIRDLTSGFIVVRKNLLKESDFLANYGDYCPVLLKRLAIRGAKMQEIGYLCLPRLHGQSKTGSSIFSYVGKGFPYLFRSLREVTKKGVN